MNGRGRSAYDVLLVTIVAAVSVAIAVGIFARRASIVSGRAMIDELFVMRSGVLLYRSVNGACPPVLGVLDTEPYPDVGGKGVQYAQRLHRDEKGHVIDPFGNPYSYDSATGWVKSTTKGYERW